MVAPLTIQANQPKVLVDRCKPPALKLSEEQEEIRHLTQLRSHHLGIAAEFERKIERLKQK